MSTPDDEHGLAEPSRASYERVEEPASSFDVSADAAAPSSSVSVSVASDRQPMLDALRREEEEAQRDAEATLREEQYSRSVNASRERTGSFSRAPGSLLAALDEEEGDPYADGEQSEYRGRARSGGYVPPKMSGVAAGSAPTNGSMSAATALLPTSASRGGNPFASDDESMESSSFASIPAVIPSSFAAYRFAPPSRSREQRKEREYQMHTVPPAAASSAAAASSSGSSSGLTQRTVNATDLERSLLEHDHGESDHTPAAPGPLLLQYSEATSTIRKDFTTVDWFFAKSQMHRVRRLMRSQNAGLGWKGKLRNWVLAAQGWVILFLVGVLSAMSAYVVHHVSSWLSDLKGGYCHGHNIFSTRRVCCMDEQTPGEVCKAWYSWSHGVAEMGSPGAYVWNMVIYCGIATLFATGGSWVCVVYARQAAGSGIAELKIVLGGFVIKKFLGIRTLFLKSVGLTLAVASGMSLGKEGPMVHIACAWGHILSRPFLKYRSNAVKKAEVLSAAVAAGVCAAFGSPLGGVLFALEAVTSYFPPKTMWRSFWCAICTALVLQWMDPFQTGKLVQFAVDGLSWQWFELVPFALLGAMGGLLGGLFNKLSVLVSIYRKKTPWWRSNPVLEVTVIAAVTALLSYPIIFMRGNSGSLLAQLFSNCGDDMPVEDDNDRNQGSNSVMAALCTTTDKTTNILLLLVACIIKFLLTTVTYGATIPSGVFMPSLCIGALMGRALGWLMFLWHQNTGDVGLFAICAGRATCVNPALYAVIGAASLLGGITRMTVALAVIMFEVTGGLSTIVPIMVAVVCSKWFGDAVSKQGLYGCLIDLNGLPHIDTHVEIDLINPAVEMMSGQPVCFLTYGETLASVRDKLAEYGYHGFPIIDNARDRLATGFIARSDLEVRLDKVSDSEWARADELSVHFSSEPPPFPAPHFLDLSEMVDKHPLLVRPSMPADRIMSMFQSLGLRYVLSCSPRGRILGIIKKKDLLAFLAKNNIKHK